MFDASDHFEPHHKAPWIRNGLHIPRDHPLAGKPFYITSDAEAQAAIKLIEHGGEFFILWNPASEKPSRVVFLSREAAEACAARWTGKEGSIFYVLAALSLVKPRANPVEVEPIAALFREPVPRPKMKKRRSSKR